MHLQKGFFGANFRTQYFWDPDTPPPSSNRTLHVSCPLQLPQAPQKPNLFLLLPFQLSHLALTPSSRLFWGAHLAQCARSASAVQLFGRVAVLETHTL